MAEAGRFFLVALALGILALPLAFHLFPRFPDRGYGLGRATILVLAGYGYWIGRIAGVIPSGRAGAVLLLLLVAGVSAVVFARSHRQILRWLVRSWPLLLLVEGVFATAFFGYAALRSYNPEIDATEKPMDFAFLNASVVSPDYPPQDPWLAGHSISYYYFGYVQMGYLSQLSGVPTSYGFNLGLTWTFAAGAVAAMSLSMALVTHSRSVRRRFPRSLRTYAAGAGILAAILLLVVGNLEGVLELLRNHGKASGIISYAAIENLTDAPRSDTWYPNDFWWWFRASRVVPGTINEFPFFSFILGDLHPHVMAIPLTLVAIGLGLSAWLSRRPLDGRTVVRQPWTVLALGLLVGALAFENTWDLPTFGLLLVAAVLLSNWARRQAAGEADGLRAALGVLPGSLAFLAPVFAIGVLAYLPFYTSFSSQASGVEVFTQAGTRPFHFLLLFGPLLAAALFIPFALRRLSVVAAAIALILAILPFAGWLVGISLSDVGGRDALDARGSGWITLAALAVLFVLFATAALSSLSLRRSPLGFAGLCGAFALMLLIGAELFYIQDFFNSRINTVFKLDYQAWILLSPVAAFGVFHAIAAVRFRPALRYAAVPLAPVALVLALGGLVYTATAIPGRTEGFSAETTTLDGLEQYRAFRPNDAAALVWLRENVDPGEVIIEGSGRGYQMQDGQPVLVRPEVDYRDGSRISAFSGYQTPIGWVGHELQWRGSADPFLGRDTDIDTLYLTEDPAEALRVLQKYGARYVVVGSKELESYPGERLDKFSGFMRVVFESGPVRIYRLPEAIPASAWRVGG